MILDFVYLFGGLLLLVKAADWMVDGAVGLAERFGVSPTVVGLTIVAYGTSFPELVVSVISAARGVDGIAVGNIVGSNVANIGLVLGTTAVTRPFLVRSGTLFTRDLPLLGLATGVAVLFFSDGQVQRWEGLVLLAVAAYFTFVCLRGPAEEHEGEEPAAGEQDLKRAVVLLIVGVIGLLAGAHFMVEGGISVARAFGISERIIGLTIVAIGTSLPEMAASVAGALKGHPGLAVGNVVGSCLFNLAFVLGAASLVRPINSPIAEMRVELVVMVGLTALMWLMMRAGRKLTRPEGAVLLALYAGFLTYLGVVSVG